MRMILAAAALLAAAPLQAFEHDVCGAEPGCRAATRAELAALRGGFDLHTRSGRLRIDIGITRGVAVNGRVVATSSLAEALIVQLGPGNAAIPASAFHRNAVPTIVQNTLDNQKLETFTILNASVNSLSAMNTLRIGQMMERATRASGR